MTTATLHLTLAEVAAACAADGEGLPMPAHSDDERHFGEPWQAHAFALTLLLHERGAFTWPQWAATLAAVIADARARGEVDDGTGYYRHWLDALERITIERNITSAEQLHALEHAWEDAAARTPHGQPVVLSPAPE